MQDDTWVCQMGNFLYHRCLIENQQHQIMKTIFLFPILLYMILLTGCQTTSDSSSSGSSTPATKYGSEVRTTLIFEYDESQLNNRPAPYNTINNELDRFNYLEQNFETVFREELSEYDLDFQLYPANVPENAVVLELTFLSLDSPSPIELELRMWIILSKGDKKMDFGVIRSRIVPQRPMTQGSVERDLNAIYTDAAKKILEKISAEF